MWHYDVCTYLRRTSLEQKVRVPPTAVSVADVSHKQRYDRYHSRTSSKTAVCGYQSLFPRLYRLLITKILQDHPGSSRQTLRCFLIVDPRACGCAHNPHNPPRCVSTPPPEKEKTCEETTVPQVQQQQKTYAGIPTTVPTQSCTQTSCQTVQALRDNRDDVDQP